MLSNHQNVIRPLKRAVAASALLTLVASPAFASTRSHSTARTSLSTSYSKLSMTTRRTRPHPTTTAPAPTTTAPAPTTTAPTTTAPAPTTTAPTTTAPAPTTTAPTTTAPTTTAPAPTTTAPTATSSYVYGPGFPAAGLFGSASNYWNTKTTSAPINTNSAGMVANLANQVSSLYGGIAAFNAHNYNVAFYTVDANTPRADVRFWDCQNKGYLPTGLTEQFAQVPVPPNAITSPGTDSTLTVYSPSLDKVWDFWQMKKGTDGVWSACWGGRMDNVSTTTQGYFSGGFGASGSGLAHFAGSVTFADMKRGYINHVLALAVPKLSPWNDYSWPAQRSDGSSSDAAWDAIPDGTRFRLDPSINVDAYAGLTSVARMVAKAAQTYGFVVSDRAGCVSVIAESGAGIKATTGTDPWTAYLGSTPDYLVMQNFPWSKMQAMPRDWLKP